MLLLFNSAFRPQYIENVLNTLNLPFGSTNTYQYSISSNNKCYIDTSAQVDNCAEGDQVLIIFTDRAIPDDFKFFPLRKGVLIESEERQGIIYYHVELHEICNVENIAVFTETLKASANGLLFNKSAGGEETGYFAFKIDIELAQSLQINEMSWRKNSEFLSQCDYFKKVFPVFTRFKLYTKNGKKSIHITKSGYERFYKLRIGKQYIAKIDYYLPDADVNPEKVCVEMQLEAIPDCFSSTFPVRRLGAKASMVKYGFSIDDISRNTELSYGLTKLTAEIDKKLMIASRPVLIRSKRSVGNWALIISCVIVIVLCTVMKGFDLDEILAKPTPVISQGLFSFYYDKCIICLASFASRFKEVYSALTSLVITTLTVAISVLWGKKK